MSSKHVVGRSKDAVVGLLTVMLYFFDRKFKKYEYGWTCKLPSPPRIGDEISLPNLKGGGPLYHKDTLWAASNAVVRDITWFLDDGVEVAVYCDLLWEYPDQPNPSRQPRESASVGLDGIVGRPNDLSEMKTGD